MSKGQYLGEFEQLVLLALLQRDGDGYGVAVRDEIEERTGRRVGIGSVYSTLDRLQRKGWLESSVAPPEPVRGGRTKTLYRVTRSGLQALHASREMVDRMSRGLDLTDLRETGP